MRSHGLISDPPALTSDQTDQTTQTDPTDEANEPRPERGIPAVPISFAHLIGSTTWDQGGSAEPPSPVSRDASTDLATIESLAESNHPALQLGQARIADARGKASQAALPYNPTLQYQGDEIGNDGNAGLHSVTYSQRMVTANKLGIAQQERLQVVQRRVAEYDLIRLQVLTEVRSSFAELLIAQERSAITDSIAQLARRSEETVKSLMDAGEVSRIAYLQARVEARQAALAAKNAVATTDQKRRALAATVGVDALPTETVCGELPDTLAQQPWGMLSHEIGSLSPQISGAAAELERARWALRLACAQVTPDVTGQIGVGYDAGTDDTFATVGISVPLPIRNRNQGNIRSAQAQVSAASANIDRTAFKLQKALADAVGRYEVARQTYQQLRGEILPDAEEAFQLARTAFESEEANFLQVLTAQRTWFDTRLAAINALENAKKAEAEIQGSLATSVSVSP